MPKRSPAFPMEDAPNYNPDDPYADKVALADHKHYMLGQHFIREARARVWHIISAMYADRCAIDRSLTQFKLL